MTKVSVFQLQGMFNGIDHDLQTVFFKYDGCIMSKVFDFQV